MDIGINAAAAVKQPRTGVEEYTYQLIKHLTMLPEAREHRFLLYIPSVNVKTKIYSSSGATKRSAVEKFSTRHARSNNNYLDFSLPPNFEIKILHWPLPFLWTQIRLAWKMLFNPPDVLFIPVHILPLSRAKKSVVAIHGLEYEYVPHGYSLWRRIYLRWSTKRALKRADKIIAISENTKQDLVKLYGAEQEKIKVVHHGIDNGNFVIPAKAGIHPATAGRLKAGMTIGKPYLLYLGRIEQKKNINGILDAYEILKNEYKIPHELVLAGAPGFGYDKLKSLIHNSKFIIREVGYADESVKWKLFYNADIFLFPSFYEGFGLPVLEAQAAGIPAVTSFNSCLPEVAGAGALFVNPENPAQIAEAVRQIIDDKALRDKLIKSGYENVKLFSWEKCAQETLKNLI